MARVGTATEPAAAPEEQHSTRGTVAIFDLDRTILPGSSLAILARALVRHGLIPPRSLFEVGARNLAFRRRGASDSTVSRIVVQVLELAAGMSVADLGQVVEELRRELVSASRPELRRRILRHRARGDHCIVLTASPVEIAQIVATGLGAQSAIGTTAEVRDGRYTGRLVGPVCHGTGKLSALDAAAVHPDWERSWAYSDSASDLPVLQTVGNPVAVSPDRALLKVARSRQWEVLQPPRPPRGTARM